MSLGTLLFRLLFPRRYRAHMDVLSRFFAMREALRIGTPADQVLQQAANDEWEFVETGDEVLGDRVRSLNPKQCDCGVDWWAATLEQLYNRKPNAQDFANQYAAVAWPPLGPCDEPCIARETFRGKWYILYRHKVNPNSWKLYTAKRIQWHCEFPVNPSVAARRHEGVAS